MIDNTALVNVLGEVHQERYRQEEKWGQQNHPDGTGRLGDVERAFDARLRCQQNSPDNDNWRDILDEEVKEAFAEYHPDQIRAELVQVAAVAVAWIEAIDRRASSKTD